MQIKKDRQNVGEEHPNFVFFFVLFSAIMN